MDLFRDKVLVNGKEISSPDLGWTLCYPFNMLNRLPVLSIPSGLASNGVPTGVQIVGKPFEDTPETFPAGNPEISVQVTPKSLLSRTFVFPGFENKMYTVESSVG